MADLILKKPLLIVKPKIKVDNIIVEVDPQNKDILQSWGPKMPVIKINDYILAADEIIDFDIDININTIPTFSFQVNDNNYAIRKILNKTKIDKCVIFIGFKDWYIKFNGIIKGVNTAPGDDKLELEGILYNEKLYETFQKSYKNKTVKEILKELSEKTDMGLFIIDNNDLNKKYDYILNTNTTFLEFFEFVIVNYTTNFWCLDTSYVFHVADYENLLKQKIDKYTINYKGEKVDEEDMILSTYNFKDLITDEKDNEEKKWKVDYYSINNNFGISHLSNNKDYNLYFPKNDKINLKTNEKLGMGENPYNTFIGFKNHTFPFYKNRLNKTTTTKSIKLLMVHIIFELTPFSIVNLEVYLPKLHDSKYELDKENSGKKIVTGYGFHYRKRDDNVKYPQVRQSINLI